MPKLGGKIFNLSRVEIFHSTGFGLLYAGIVGLAESFGKAAVLASPWVVGLGIALGAACILYAIHVKRKQDALDKEQAHTEEKSRAQAVGVSRAPELQQEAVREESPSRFVEKYLQQTQDPHQTRTL